MTEQDINNIVWWIPFRKTRNSLRNILLTISDNSKAVSDTNQLINDKVINQTNRLVKNIILYNNDNSRMLGELEAELEAEYGAFPQSKLAHQYLDGLNGIEIGASSFNSYGLRRTGKYQNVDYSAYHGGRWQPGSSLPTARVDVVACGDNLPFDDNSLDYVLSSHVIEHFFDPIKAIEEWFRVIKKGGYIFMIVPHKERTFDRLRPLTSVEELLDRHSAKLTETDYAWKTGQEQMDKNDKSSLCKDVMIVCDNEITPEGYVRPDGWSDRHHSVWKTENFVELCNAMKWNIVERHDVDDKEGSGFTIVLQK